MIQPIIPQAVITWALIIVSLLLVAGITYIYSNRNKQLTGLLLFITAVVICFIKLISIVHIKLESSFLGGYSESNEAYIAAKPGWDILFHSWQIWILPVLAVALIAVVILIMVMLHQFSKDTKVDIRPTTPPPPAAAKSESVSSMTSSQKLNTFMAIDAAKKASHESHEKLAEALLQNASYEIKISDLNLRVRELEQTLADTEQQSSEEIETLELELQAKTKENEYIIEQLSIRTKELKRAQDMFEKLMALHKQEK